MQKLNDLSRSLTPLKPDGTLIAVIEMSLSSWLVAGIVPGIERQPLKKLEVDESTLLKLLIRWREEAKKSGHSLLQQQCDHSQGTPSTLRGSSAEFSCKRQQRRTQPTGNCPDTF